MPAKEDSLEREQGECSSRVGPTGAPGSGPGLAQFAPAKRELLRRGSRYDIELVTMELRGGGTTQREVIRHPGSVLVLPVLEQAGQERKIVMIWNWRISLEAWLLELPAGTMHAGEDPLVCAARELEEETGYTATKLDFVRSFFVAPGLADERMHLFVARGLTPCSREMDADERIVVAPMSVDEVLGRVRNGAIEDAKTMLALRLWADWERDAGRA
jgi:ADP-ribose pyrophosphatase